MDCGRCWESSHPPFIAKSLHSSLRNRHSSQKAATHDALFEGIASEPTSRFERLEVQPEITP